MDLVLYGAPRTPFVRKAEVVLRKKAIAFEMENLGMPFPDWFKETSSIRTNIIYQALMAQAGRRVVSR